MKSLIRATNLWGYDELVRRRGGDPLALLSKYSIPPAEERPDQAFLPYVQVAALIEETARALRYPEFGLKLAAYQGMEILGPISVIARSSATIAAALNSIARYLYLHCPALKLVVDIHSGSAEGIALMKFEINDKAIKQKTQSYELSLANGMQIMKLLGGGSLSPQRVFFPHAQQGSSEAYEETFGCEVVFEHPWCGVYLPISALGKQLSSADYQTWQMAERYLESRFVPDTSSTVAKVVELIRSLLPTFQCSSQTIADHLSLHRRTLQRRLADEGVTYERLLDEERRALAERYLRQIDMRFDHIAGLLGYSEQSVFNRACQKWFAMTPSAYRKQLQLND